ncbi:MAG TPA: ImmA/IrrE family metallo-endopeptidase [Clostridiaceae bacterium]|nr:ImmA/IrrE family metallo-endopeptidase [Clostridiaceae bacterium]
MTLLELYNLAEKEDIEIDYFPMKEVTAMSFPEGWIALNADKINTSVEEKVYLAHELGHYMTGSFYNVNSKLDVKSRHENRANRWAIKKLVPKTKFKKAIRSGFREPWELAEYLEVPDSFVKEAAKYYKAKGEDL